MFECVVNVSEGRDLALLDRLSKAAGPSLRDRHHDRWHNRSVFTLVNAAPALAEDVKELARRALRDLDIREHAGVHPRLGILDVVPFVAYRDDPSVAIQLRHDFGRWLARWYQIPIFFYGGWAAYDGRSLPDIRRHAFVDLWPDLGPPRPHPLYGATAVGARGPLVAWNIWLRDVSLADTRAVAAAVRQDGVRTLGLEVGTYTQVSCNLTAPDRVGPGFVYDEVAARVGEDAIDHCELVGLIPDETLRREPKERWGLLGLAATSTIESRVGPLR